METFIDIIFFCVAWFIGLNLLPSSGKFKREFGLEDPWPYDPATAHPNPKGAAARTKDHRLKTID